MSKIKWEVIEDATIMLGLAISIDQIKTVLGIILLTFQIGLILYKGVKLVITKVKNKDYAGAIKDAEDTVKKVDEEIKKYEDRDKDSK